MSGTHFAGTGTFGRVKLARGLSDGRFYALKVLWKEQLLRLKQVQHVLNERRLLAAVDHPNIVKMWGFLCIEPKPSLGSCIMRCSGRILSDIPVY